MAHKVSAGGSYRLDKVFPPPVGRLLALKARRVAIAQVLDADRGDTLDALLASLTLTPEAAPLWPAVGAWLGPKAARSLTVRRYGSGARPARAGDAGGLGAPGGGIPPAPGDGPTPDHQDGEHPGHQDSGLGGRAPGGPSVMALGRCRGAVPAGLRMAPAPLEARAGCGRSRHDAPTP